MRKMFQGSGNETTGLPLEANVVVLGVKHPSARGYRDLGPSPSRGLYRYKQTSYCM